MPPSLDDIFGLLNVGKAAQESDPFMPLQQSTGAFDKALMQKAGENTKGAGGALVAGLLSGLVGGGAQNLSNDYQARQQDLANQVTGNVLQGSAFARPEGMSDSVFSRLANARSAFQVQRQLEDDARLKGIEDHIAENRFGNPLYEPLGGAQGPQQVHASRGPDGQLLVDFGKPNAGPGGGTDLIQSALIKARQGEERTREEEAAMAAAPLAIQAKYQEAATQAAIEDRSRRVGEKSAMDIMGPVAIGQDIRSNLGALETALGKDPSLAEKAWSSLPLGSDARNSMMALQIGGARAAKDLEGRVNETTLKLYTDFLTSASTEPLSAVMKRGEAFVESLKSDATAKANGIKATGRDTSGLEKAIESLIPQKADTGGYSESDLKAAGYTAKDIEALRQQGKVK